MPDQKNKQVNEPPKPLLRKTARPERRSSGVQRLPPKMRDQKKNIPAFRGAIENARPEKKQFRVQVRPPKIVDQKNTRPRAAELTTLRKKCATRKTHFGFQWRSRTTRDQKNIPAFRGGHRKFATRKTTFWRSGAAISNARPETKTTSNGNNLA